MTYKSILVHIDSSPESERRVGVAAGLAAAFKAHLSGLAIVPPLELPQRLRSHPGAKAILKEEFDKALAAAQALAGGFPQRAKAGGATSADAKVVQGEPLEALGAAARAADLVVLSQPEEDDVAALGTHFVEHALVDLGRPVLLVPRKAAVKGVGHNVLVAWKNASASARALADARPLLVGAQSVTVLAVDEGAGASPQEALDYLQRHGAKASGMVVKAENPGEAIVAQAKKLGADLVVMGAFARPRLREMILGGATHHVLPNASTCVFMSH